MHERKAVRNLIVHLEMGLDGFVWKVIDVISLPIPLHSSRQQGIEQRLNGREWHRTGELKDRSRQSIGDGLDVLLSFISGPVIARNNSADLASPNVLRERRGRWNVLQTEENRHLAIFEVLGVGAIPLHNGRGILLGKEDGTTKDCTNRLGLEEETGNDAKVPSSASNRPEEI